MIWYIIIALAFMLLLWILLGPVVLTLDTSSDRYRLMLPGVVSISLVPGAGFFHIRGWIFFVPFRLDPLKMGKRRKRSGKGDKEGNTVDGKRKEKGKKKRGFNQVKKIRKISRAIRVRRLELDLDTDDYLLNAWLVPAFAAINSYDNIQMNVNFEGNLFLHMDVRTRVGALMWRFLQAR